MRLLWAICLARFGQVDALLVMAAAALSRLGFQPQGWYWATIAGFALWLALLQRSTFKRALWLGYLFGVCHFALNFTWLVPALSRNNDAPWVVGVLGVVGLAAVVALYPMLVAGGLALLRPRPLLVPPLAATLWVCSEWLRGHLFSGFPWGQSGMAWMPWQSLIQVADLGGIYLLSFLLLLTAAVVRLLFDPTLSARLRIGWLMGVALLLCGGHLYGQFKLLQPVPQTTYRVALVQGGVPQLEKWQKPLHDEHLDRYLGLSLDASGEKLDLLVWPETALAYFLQAEPARQARIAGVVRSMAVPLLFGVPHAVRQQPGVYRYYNGLGLMDGQGRWVATYHKHHLVPFGEYLPLRAWLPAWMDKITPGKQDFAQGAGPLVLPSPAGVLGPLLCYEVIFPAEVRQLANQGAALLVNATNDAWFGETAKPQHLQMARLRTIENRLPLVRVANTGISASFDAYGRAVGQLPVEQPGVAVHPIPHAPAGGSFYRRWGDWEGLFWAALLLLFGVANWAARKG
ncbi:apolipoprotein N-acyltransferase [Magnetococcus marinus]|uniref:apolipoprotein N-acyltransferase n=1 Tax=Magnetococcus marinus TaxID=1124597 RepID=UPI00135F17E1|nr:apolipoprotein N-acyltransferase [Magnetococcus marinus]